MNLKRAVLCGALFWVLIFFEVSILKFGLKLPVDLTYYIVHYAAILVLTLISALIYFDIKQKSGFNEGFLLGVVFVLAGFILDFIVTVPLFIRDYKFFNDVYLWMGYAEIVVVATVIGGLKK